MPHVDSDDEEELDEDSDEEELDELLHEDDEELSAGCEDEDELLLTFPADSWELLLEDEELDDESDEELDEDSDEDESLTLLSLSPSDWDDEEELDEEEVLPATVEELELELDDEDTFPPDSSLDEDDAISPIVMPYSSSNRFSVRFMKWPIWRSRKVKVLLAAKDELLSVPYFIVSFWLFSSRRTTFSLAVNVEVALPRFFLATPSLNTADSTQ